jgi:hypothetical protein
MTLWLIPFALTAVVALPVQSQQRAQNVDWFTVLESLAIPSAEEFTSHPWQKARTLPWVAWASNDVQRSGTSMERRGKVIVTLSGKPLLVSGRIHAWDFGARGADVGIVQVWLSSAANHVDLSLDVERDFQARDVDWAAIGCGQNSRSTGATFYQVEPIGKKTFWLLHTWRCQTSGCAVEFRAFYQNPSAEELGATLNPCPA